jgi:hypothetical protein
MHHIDLFLCVFQRVGNILESLGTEIECEGLRATNERCVKRQIIGDGRVDFGKQVRPIITSQDASFTSNTDKECVNIIAMRVNPSEVSGNLEETLPQSQKLRQQKRSKKQRPTQAP